VNWTGFLLRITLPRMVLPPIEAWRIPASAQRDPAKHSDVTKIKRRPDRRSFLFIETIRLRIHRCRLNRKLDDWQLRSSSHRLNFNDDTRKHLMRSEPYQFVWTPKRVIGQPDMEQSAESNHKHITTPKNRPAHALQKCSHWANSTPID